MSYGRSSSDLKGVMKGAGYWVAWLYVAHKFAFPPTEPPKDKSTPSKSKPAGHGPSEKGSKAKAKDGKSGAMGNATGMTSQENAATDASKVTSTIDGNLANLVTASAEKVQESMQQAGEPVVSTLNTVVNEAETVLKTVSDQLSSTISSVENESVSWLSWITNTATFGLFGGNASPSGQDSTNWPRSSGLNEWPTSSKAN